MPGDFLSARGEQKPLSAQDETADKDSSGPPWKDTHEPGKTLNPGAQQFLSFRIPHANVHWYSPMMNPRLLTFFPYEYDVWLQFTYERPGVSGEEVLTKIEKIKLEPPLISLLWGGVVGAGLLGLFVSTYRYVRSPHRPSLAQRAVSAFTFFVAGSICAVIALLLLHRIGDLPLPVNLTVHDFYGSVVIGLFTYKIGDWLHGLFFGDAGNPAVSQAQHP